MTMLERVNMVIERLHSELEMGDQIGYLLNVDEYASHVRTVPYIIHCLEEIKHDLETNVPILDVHSTSGLGKIMLIDDYAYIPTANGVAINDIIKDIELKREIELVAQYVNCYIQTSNDFYKTIGDIVDRMKGAYYDEFVFDNQTMAHLKHELRKYYKNIRLIDKDYTLYSLVVNLMVSL